MKIKGLQLTKIGTGQGFFIPVAHTEDRVEGGLVIGRRYDIDISEAE